MTPPSRPPATTPARWRRRWAMLRLLLRPASWSGLLCGYGAGPATAKPNNSDNKSELSETGADMSEWLEVGKKAPDFKLPADDGSTFKLSDQRGKIVVLYFYPKANTPGCTVEACSFRDRSSELKKLGAVVVGVSPDAVERLEKFRDQHHLNFPLLADTEHQVAEKYGAWRGKTMFGNTFMGIHRSTYLIDTEGRIAKIWKSVKVAQHDQQVIDAVSELKAQA